MMTWNDLARYYWRHLTVEEADTLLWAATCFPFGYHEQVEEQLADAFVASGGHLGIALSQADEALSVAMKNCVAAGGRDER